MKFDLILNVLTGRLTKDNSLVVDMTGVQETLSAVRQLSVLLFEVDRVAPGSSFSQSVPSIALSG